MSNLDESNTIPFTARLIAYHRKLETENENPLIEDKYANKLAGNLDEYIIKHGFTALRRDYSIVRAYYIESNLLSKWVKKHNRSQIVLLGAGLDARAYRLEYLKNGDHTIFEVDFPKIISYKSKILNKEKLFCQINRISADLVHDDWMDQLKQKGYNPKTPTFWILEGLIYYLGKENVNNLLISLMKNSNNDSKLFADICVPIFAELKFGAFTPHFKWGLSKEKIHNYFDKTGWNVKSYYADDFDQGRDAGQKGMIFVIGIPHK